MAALGATKAELMGPSGRPSPAPFAIAFLAELVMAWTLAGIIGHAGPVTVANGLICGALAWAGFVATTLLVNHQLLARQACAYLDRRRPLAGRVPGAGSRARRLRRTLSLEKRRAAREGSPSIVKTAVRLERRSVAVQAPRTSAEARIQVSDASDRGLRQ